RRHTRFSRDWSSDVCSSDLRPRPSEEDVEPGVTPLDQQESGGIRLEQLVHLVVGDLSEVVIPLADGTEVRRPPKAVHGVRGRLRSEERRVGKECEGQWTRRA